MPDGNSTALLSGLLVLTAVSLATLTFIGRSRLRSRYLLSDEDDPKEGSAAGVRDSGTVARGRATVPVASGGGGGEKEGGGDSKEEKEGELPALLKAYPPCWQNPLVLGFNKLKPRTTLGAFSSVQQARYAYDVCIHDPRTSMRVFALVIRTHVGEI